VTFADWIRISTHFREGLRRLRIAGNLRGHNQSGRQFPSRASRAANEYPTPPLPAIYLWSTYSIKATAESVTVLSSAGHGHSSTWPTPIPMRVRMGPVQYV